MISEAIGPHLKGCLEFTACNACSIYPSGSLLPQTLRKFVISHVVCLGLLIQNYLHNNFYKSVKKISFKTYMFIYQLFIPGDLFIVTQSKKRLVKHW